MKLRRWAFAAVAAVSLFALTACGNGDSSDAGSSGSSSAPTSDGVSQDAGNDSGGSGQGASGAALTAKTFGAALANAASEAGSAHMVVQTSANGANLSMTGDIGGLGGSLNELAMGIRMKVPGTGTAKMRIVDSDLYLKIPGLSSGSKPWARIPLDDPNNPFGSLYQQLLTLTDPTAMEASYSTFRTFKYVGSETVDGVKTQHYRVSVDTAKALKAAGVDELGGIPIKDVLKSLPKVATSDLWLDADSHPIKISSTSSAAVYQVHYSRWGQPVHVAAPPASQVQDLSL